MFQVARIPKFTIEDNNGELFNILWSSDLMHMAWIKPRALMIWKNFLHMKQLFADDIDDKCKSQFLQTEFVYKYCAQFVHNPNNQSRPPGIYQNSDLSYTLDGVFVDPACNLSTFPPELTAGTQAFDITPERPPSQWKMSNATLSYVKHQFKNLDTDLGAGEGPGPELFTDDAQNLITLAQNSIPYTRCNDFMRYNGSSSKLADRDCPSHNALSSDLLKDTANSKDLVSGLMTSGGTGTPYSFTMLQNICIMNMRFKATLAEGASMTVPTECVQSTSASNVQSNQFKPKTPIDPVARLPGGSPPARNRKEETPNSRIMVYAGIGAGALVIVLLLIVVIVILFKNKR